MAAICHSSIVQPWKSDMLCRTEAHARLGVCKIACGVKLCRPVAPTPQEFTRRTAMLHRMSDVRQKSQLLTRAATQSTGEVIIQSKQAVRVCEAKMTDHACTYRHRPPCNLT